MKRPSYQWYPGDVKRDTALQACSWEARALWRDLLDIMHDGQPYGHLAVNGHAIPLTRAASMIGLSLGRVKKYLAELEAAGVGSRTPEGTLYSRRMVRDEDIRNRRAEGGALSLENPNVPQPKGPPEGYPPDHPSLPSFGGSPAVAVAVASAIARETTPSTDARAREEIRWTLVATGMDDSGKAALEGFRRAAHKPLALLTELESLINGLNGPGGRGIPPPILGRALHDMQLAGVEMSGRRLRAFAQGALEGDPPPRRNGTRDQDDHDAKMQAWVKRKEQEIEAKRARQTT